VSVEVTQQKEKLRKVDAGVFGGGVFQKFNRTVESVRGGVSIYRGSLDLVDQ
jgi:hypothetical protein